MNQKLASLIQEQQNAFYLFDTIKLKKRIKYLQARLPEEISLCYAVKANPFITKEIGDELERFEICSPGEAEICKSLGIPNNKMVISGIYKTPSAIEELVADESFDGIFTAESISQYLLLCKLADTYKIQLKVLLRLTNDSQFGMNEEDIEKMISGRSFRPRIEHVGIQFFSGTQKTSLSKYRRELKHLDEFLVRLKESYDYEAEELEYGPGFPAAYFVTDEIDEEELLNYFSELISDMVSKPKIVLELGRSIAASCGQYYTRIVDMKKNKGQNYALIDGGMHHIVYFGQHMAMKHPYLSVVDKEDSPKEEAWTICGSLCSMNDIVAKQIYLPRIQIGDTICFENTGAYCMTEGISIFLSRDIPSVYILQEDGNLLCARKSFETMQLNTPIYERSF